MLMELNVVLTVQFVVSRGSDEVLAGRFACSHRRCERQRNVFRLVAVGSKRREFVKLLTAVIVSGTNMDLKTGSGISICPSI
jgi:hypothetical protein